MKPDQQTEYIVQCIRESGSMYEDDARQFLAERDGHVRAEVLAADGQAYDGELVMLRSLVRTLRAVVRPDDADMGEVRRLLHHHASDNAAAREKGSPTGADATPAPDLHEIILSAVESFRSRADGPGSLSQQLANHLLTAVAPLVPYREIWDASLPPGGRVCGTCGQPVESEPCPDHGRRTDVTEEAAR